MAICHEHNLASATPASRPYGIRVHLRRDDPFRDLLGEDTLREHWYATSTERDRALESMSSRYLYFRAGDAPALDFERLDPPS